MSLLRTAVERMEAYVPGEQPPAGARVVKLNTNENPYPPSPTVAEAVRDELGADGGRLRLYSDPAALELRRAAAEVTGVPVERILAGNGSDELLSLIVRATVEPGDAIAYPEPTYVLYETLAAAQGARVLTAPFDADFTLPESLAALPARVFFVASPNSPSGNSHPAEALERLARARPDALLVVDEAYADFADADALGLVGRLPNLVVLRTFSKSYALAGLRIGLLFGPEALVAGIGKIKDSYNLDRLAIRAGAAALRDGAHMRAGVARIRATRARLVAGLEAVGYRVLPSDANFVFARGAPGRARADAARLKREGILVRYFDRPRLDDALRITVGTDEEIDLLLGALGRA